MHTKDARAAGETEQRLYGLSAWREAPYYSDRERAALAWAEAVTNISQTHASDEEYGAALAQFGDEELVKLTMAVIAIIAGIGSPSPFGRRWGSMNPEQPGPQPNLHQDVIE